MAKIGFEVNVLFPFGVSLGTYTGTDASKYTKADAGFEFGIHVTCYTWILFWNK